MPTAEQENWARKFLEPVGGAKFLDRGARPPSPRGKQAPKDHAPAGNGDASPDTKALNIPGVPSIPGLDIIIDNLDKKINGPFSCTGIIQNNTAHTLTLDAASIAKAFEGEYKELPPGVIESGGKGTFKAVGTSATDVPVLDHFDSTGAEGVVRYTFEDGKTVCSCYFNVPRIGKNKTSGDHGKSSLDGPAAQGLQFIAKHGSGNEATFNYVLIGPSGPKPTPVGGSQTSCLVTVVNQTQSTLFLRKADKASGDYMTQPATSLAPGASTQFAFIQTPGSNEAELRGLMTWDVGDPKVATWDLMWDNPTGSKNYTAGVLKPDNTGLHSLDQIGQGDENVPVTFTLSGGGSGPTPQTGKAGSCEITIVNNTKSVLSLTGRQTAAGAFATEPPTTIDAGATAKVSYASAPNSLEGGCVGSLEYSVGEDGAAAWAVDWNNPAGEANTCNGLVTPGSSGFKSSASIGPGDEKVPVSFVLSGGGDGLIEPPPEEKEFAPPPKSKQPTLRKGDESPDGWVEYAQERLNDFGAGLTVNGKFDGKMDAAVRKFQTEQKCQSDGVIGNETWSALRKGPREAVGTDGRKPHTFEQTDAEARFYHEDYDCVAYFKKDDQLAMLLVSTGEQSIESGQVVVKATKPDGTAKTVAVKVGKDIRPSPDGQGNLYTVRINKFSKVFGFAGPDEAEGAEVDAYLDQDLGGDRWTGQPEVR